MPDRLALFLKQGGKCNKCKDDLRPDAIDVDHIARRCDGGSDDASNTQLLCSACHRRKSASECAGTKREDKECTFHNLLLASMKNKPEQTCKSQNIGSLYNMYKEGQLAQADLNRNPVWEEGKQRAYVWTLFEGRVTPPMFVNNARSENVRYIYDGGNRFHSICEFIEGRLTIHVKRGGQTLKGKYCQGDCDTAINTYMLNDKERNHFNAINIDVFEWDDLSEEVACDLASLLNKGTQMNVSERLKLQLATNTPRASLVRKLYESESLSALRNNNSRENLLKPLVKAVRSMLTGSGSLEHDMSMRPKHTILAKFLACDSDVHNPDAVSEIICAAANAIAEDGCASSIPEFVKRLGALQ